MPPLTAALPHAFYDRATTEVARDLVGCALVHRYSEAAEGYLAGIIVETEAYGPDDLASHAARGPSRRNAAMFGPPGHAYVYRIYGAHWCLNAVTRPTGVGEAVLIRALEPVAGIDVMRRRRGTDDLRALCSGPGKLCAAFAITGEHNGADLASDDLFIAAGETGAERPITTTTRIGITRAAHLDWRYYLTGSRFVSRR